MGAVRRAVAAAVGLWLALAAPAASQDLAPNKEGVWSVGRSEPDSPACYAVIENEAGEMFTLRADASGVLFSVQTPKPIRPGREARLETEAYGFYFAPRYSESGDALYSGGPLNQGALAALRLARSLKVKVDRRAVLDIDLKGSGVGDALDALVACAAGQSGWWGAGAVQPPPGAAPAKPPMNEQGVWSVAAGQDPGACSAVAKLDDDKVIALLGDGRRLTISLASTLGFKRGRKGLLELDEETFEFSPVFDTPAYLHMGEYLDGEALLILRRARTARILVDGEPVAIVPLEGTGHAEVLADLAACARGEKGWWGEGAQAP